MALYQRFLQENPELIELNHKFVAGWRVISTVAQISLIVLLLIIINPSIWYVFILSGVAGITLSSRLHQRLYRKVPYEQEFEEALKVYLPEMFSCIEDADIRYFNQPADLKAIRYSGIFAKEAYLLPCIQVRNGIEGHYKGCAFNAVAVYLEHPTDKRQLINFSFTSAILLRIDFPEAPVREATIYSKWYTDLYVPDTSERRLQKDLRKMMPVRGVRIPISQPDADYPFVLHAPSLADGPALNQKAFLDTLQRLFKAASTDCHIVSIYHGRLDILIHPGRIFRPNTTYKIAEVNIFYIYYLETLNLLKIIDALDVSSTQH